MLSEDELTERKVAIIQQCGIVCHRGLTIDGLVEGYEPMPDCDLSEVYNFIITAIARMEHNGAEHSKSKVLQELYPAAIWLYRACYEGRIGAFAKVIPECGNAG